MGADAGFEGFFHRSLIRLTHSCVVNILLISRDGDGRRDAQPGNAKDKKHSPERPPLLHALEVLDAVPALVFPRQLPALDSQVDRDDQPDVRDETQQPDPRLVGDRPYPVEQERAPAPALYAGRRNDGLAAA